MHPGEQHIPESKAVAAPRRWLAALGVIVGLAVVHVVLAYLASRGNSSTFDEPLHAAAARVALGGDYSVNPEHPPLWKYFAGMAGRGVIGEAAQVPGEVRKNPVAEWGWAVGWLYKTAGVTGGGVDGEKFVAASRVGMLAFGFALVVVGGGLGWRVGGKGAGVLAAVLLAFDPLVLGHTPVVSDDVAVTVMLLGVAWCGLELRRGARWGWGILLGLLLAGAVTAKFTGVLGVPIAAGLLLIRRGQGRPRWAVLGVAAVVGYVGLWGVYGFRYAPSSEGLIDTSATVTRIGQMRLLAEGKDPGSAPLPGADLVTRCLVGVEKLHVVPQAFTAGLLMTYGVTRGNPAFAAGQYSGSGFWWYFPFAALVKTPVGLLVAWGVGAVCAFRGRHGQDARAMGGRLVGGRLVGVPLLWVLGLLVVGTVASPLNIGIRHAMPALALVTVLAAAQVARYRFRIQAVIVGALAVEVLAGFPHYIPFFNVAGQVIGPRMLLADSNLDWGQDLGRLAAWRKEHPEGRLYLAYWGTAHPDAYGLEVVNLPKTYEFAAQAAPDPAVPGYVAVSVTYLQGVNNGGVVPGFYERLLGREPVARIGKSIVVWRYPGGS